MYMEIVLAKTLKPFKSLDLNSGEFWKDKLWGNVFSPKELSAYVLTYHVYFIFENKCLGVFSIIFISQAPGFFSLGILRMPSYFQGIKVKRGRHISI